MKLVQIYMMSGLWVYGQWNGPNFAVISGGHPSQAAARNDAEMNGYTIAPRA